MRCLPQQDRIKTLRTTVWEMSLKFNPASVPEIRVSGYLAESLELNPTIFSNDDSPMAAGTFVADRPLVYLPILALAAPLVASPEAAQKRCLR